ncbi:MAG: response regulator PleD [Methanoregulaceae archaeon PtaU1.Bin222]|nr:MAG: response regulator PleD [Methanoregulaceae archaeon PtaU1.Bin222]
MPEGCDLMHHILIVDDNAAITDILARIVRQEGLKATVAHSGEEALSLIRDERPDLIFLDIIMEPIDGWETLEKIKQDASTRDIPVMMITGKTLDPGEVQEYSALFEDYIQKPITRRNLCTVIRQFFRKEQEIDGEVQKARVGGADEQVLAEFRRLSRDIEVHKRLLLLMWNVYRTTDDDDSRKPAFLETIARMEGTQNEMIGRLQEIRKHVPSMMTGRQGEPGAGDGND